MSAHPRAATSATPPAERPPILTLRTAPGGPLPAPRLRRSGGRPAYRRQVVAATTLVVADVLATTLAAAVAGSLGGHGPLQAWALASLPVWLVLLWAYGFYERTPWGLRRGAAADRGAGRMLDVVLIGTAVIGGSAGIVAGGLPWGDVATLGACVAAVVTAVRAALPPALGRLLAPEQVLLVGDDPALDRLALELPAERSARAAGRVTQPADVVTALGGGVDHMVVSAALAPPELADVLDRCAGRVTRTSVAAASVGPLAALTGLQSLSAVTLVPVRCGNRSMSRAVKRAVDVAGAGIALLALSPAMAAIAVAVRLGSPGPAFFVQRRIGRDGRAFVIWKFRTMVVDAERRRESLLALSRDTGWLHLDRDPRTTPVGRWLRRTSLDELPQLWNVLRGEMSLVGPRPLIPLEHDHVPAWASVRSDVTPGISGLWQVSGRTSVPFEDMLRLDRLYALTWTVRRDLEILLRTVAAVLTGKGAN